MCKERLVVIFDNWDRSVDCEEFEKVNWAIDDCDYDTVAKYFKIENADEIKIQLAVEKYEEDDETEN